MTSSLLRSRAFRDLLAQPGVGRFPLRRSHFELQKGFIEDALGTENAIWCRSTVVSNLVFDFDLRPGDVVAVAGCRSHIG